MTKENISERGKLSPRPYARLLTMMGDQLIKNEKIALIELIKNSYDADADWVQIRFNDFKIADDENTLVATDDSSIEIEDNGIGMSFSTIRKSWMNPASPTKYLKKQAGERRSKFKGRVIQGEKGIGRFAIYKIGATVEIFTKEHLDDSKEIYLLSDFSKFDNELIREVNNEDNDPLFLEQLEFEYEIHEKPEKIDRSEFHFKNNIIKKDSHGTLIRIENIKGSWSKDKIDDIIHDIKRIKSPFEIEDKIRKFQIDVTLNGKSIFAEESGEDPLEALLRKAPIKVKNGEFSNNRLRFNLNGKEIEYDLTRLASSEDFNKRFIDGQGKLKRQPECGPFSFEYYVFDLRGKSTVPPKYWLDSKDKKAVKSHRIYLSRDSIRVYPYGDADDDWLEVDKKRGTSKAGYFLSNDQTIGRIEITQEFNPKLKDKTNREGLLEIGNAFDDFKVINRAILNIIHQEFQKYKASLDQKEAQKILKEKEIEKEFRNISEHLDKNDDGKGKRILKNLRDKYEKEKDYLIDRAEVTEDLAAVGLSVEAASHDLMLMMNKAKRGLDTIIVSLRGKNPDLEEIEGELEKTRGQLAIIEDQIKGIQPLFRSSKTRRKDHRVEEIIKKVIKYFTQDLDELGIQLEVKKKGPPLVVKTYESVLLQPLINLIDNSIYWLKSIDKKDKKIRITLNGKTNELKYSDSGPGIWDDDIEYIFEPFFSTKGEGRGLGLYICRQILERNDFTIEYLDHKKDLSGVNFLISF